LQRFSSKELVHCLESLEKTKSTLRSTLLELFSTNSKIGSEEMKIYEKAFNSEYKVVRDEENRGAIDHFMSHLNDCAENWRLGPKYYSPYFTFVQSSGTGKLAC
jgi:hypothetical protein